MMESVPCSLNNADRFDPLFGKYLHESSELHVRDMAGVTLPEPCLGLPLTGTERDALTALVDMTSYRLYRSCIDMEQRNICVSCWLQKPNCVCKSMPAKPMSGNYRVVLLMHDGEFASASNTGKIALRAGSDSSISSSSENSHDVHFSSNNSLLLFPGIPSHERALKELCDRDPCGEHTVLLFPSADALSVEQFKSNTQTNNIPSSSSSSSQQPITIIALEGTYSSARPLLRLIPPHIPRVKVEPLIRSTVFIDWRKEMQSRLESNLMAVSNSNDVHHNGKAAQGGDGSLFAALRRQPMEERLSTIEAIIAFKLQFSNELETAWLESLVCIVDALRVQSGFAQVYGSIDSQQLSKINTAKAQLETSVKANPRPITTVKELPSCRRFNRGNCSHPKCDLPHVCGHCGSAEHTITQCKESRLANYFQSEPKQR